MIGHCFLFYMCFVTIYLSFCCGPHHKSFQKKIHRPWPYSPIAHKTPSPFEKLSLEKWGILSGCVCVCVWGGGGYNFEKFLKFF